MPARRELSWKRRVHAGPLEASAEGRPPRSDVRRWARPDQLAVHQLGAVADRLDVPPAAREVLLGVAGVLTDAYRAAFEDATRASPGRRRLDPRALGDLRRWQGTARRAAEALRPLLADAERMALTAGVLWPLPLPQHRHAEPLTAGTLTFAAALGEEALTVASFGASLASLAATIPVLEILETYLTASARTNAYRRAGLAYDVELVTADLHAALTGTAQGQSARLGFAAVLADLVDRAIDKVASRAWQAVVLGVGAAWAGVGVAGRVARLADLPLVRDGAAEIPVSPVAPTRQAVAEVLRARLEGRGDGPLPELPW